MKSHVLIVFTYYSSMNYSLVAFGVKHFLVPIKEALPYLDKLQSYNGKIECEDANVDEWLRCQITPDMEDGKGAGPWNKYETPLKKLASKDQSISRVIFSGELVN